MSKTTTRRQKGKLTGKIDSFLVGLAAAALGYLGLVTWLGTSSPFMLVHGGSMEPTLHAGDLLLNRRVPPSEIRVGDVIAFDTPAEARQQKDLPATLVHRVVSVDGKGGQLVFVTKGDNSDTDRLPVPSTAVRGVMARNLGLIGRPLMFLTNTRILLMFGMPLAAFVIVVFLVSAMTPGKQRPASAPARATGMHRAVSRLADATAEYGAHLESHTSVVKSLAATAEHLQTAVSRQKQASDALHGAVIRQNRVLENLDAVVGRVAAAGVDGRRSERSERPVAPEPTPEEEEPGQRGAKAA